MTTLVLGDSHGHIGMILKAIRVAGHLGCERVVSVGDFGLGMLGGSQGYYWAESINDTAAEHGVEVLVVPGNHDNWDLIDDRVAGWTDEDPSLECQPVPYGWARLLVAPRPSTWTDEHGLRWLAVGGAASIDGPAGPDWIRQVRGPEQTAGVGVVDRGWWWPQEEIRADHVDAAIALADGEDVDILVTHDVPAEADLTAAMVDGLIWGHGAAQRDLLSRLRATVRPRVHLAGHWHTHRDHRDDIGRVVVLADDGTPDEVQWCVVSDEDEVRIPSWDPDVALTAAAGGHHEVDLASIQLG